MSATLPVSLAVALAAADPPRRESDSEPDIDHGRENRIAVEVPRLTESARADGIQDERGWPKYLKFPGDVRVVGGCDENFFEWTPAWMRRSAMTCATHHARNCPFSSAMRVRCHGTASARSVTSAADSTPTAESVKPRETVAS
ncbi:MAG: hypothetical protein L0271_09595 [Gemmatimonadetes bacterium]|nr:hypothetical protein [Gemmatimonadota bacterium]